MEDLENEINKLVLTSSRKRITRLEREEKLYKCIISLSESFKENYEIINKLINKLVIISDYKEDYFNLFVKIKEIEDKNDAIYNYVKQLTLSFEQKGDLEKTLYYASLAKFINAYYLREDIYSIDRDILLLLNRISKKVSKSYSFKSIKTEKHKKRIGHILSPFTKPLLEVDLSFAEAFSSDDFELIHIIVLPQINSIEIKSFEKENEQKKITTQNKSILKIIEKLKVSNSSNYVILNENHNTYKGFTKYVDKINGLNLDVLLYSAALMNPRDYVLAQLKCVDCQIALLNGAPVFFSGYGFDGAIACGHHLYFDSFMNTRLIPYEFDFSKIKVKNKIVNNDNFQIIICGRESKLQDEAFFDVIIKVLLKFEFVTLTIIGTSKERFILKDKVNNSILEKRISVINYCENYLDYMYKSSLLIDTHPQGGGLIILWALAMKLPILAFTHDYSNIYNQRVMSLAEEYGVDQSMLIKPFDYDKLYYKIISLIENQNNLNYIASKGRKNVVIRHGKPNRMVKSYLSFFQENLDNKLKL